MNELILRQLPSFMSDIPSCQIWQYRPVLRLLERPSKQEVEEEIHRSNVQSTTCQYLKLLPSTTGKKAELLWS